MPARENRYVIEAPGPRFPLLPQANPRPVTVWSCWSMFVQVILAPGVAYSTVGPKHWPLRATRAPVAAVAASWQLPPALAGASQRVVKAGTAVRVASQDRMRALDRATVDRLLRRAVAFSVDTP